jgi:2-oxo-4-hydroxy-4-carboxy--5-ureidoimidazoline (OHCU) decarboxylase
MTKRFNNVFIMKVEGVDKEKVIDAFLQYFDENAPKKDKVQFIPQQLAVR